MASLQLLLPRRKSLPNPSLFRSFSSKSEQPQQPPGNDAPNGDSPSSVSSKLREVIDSLKQQPPQQPPPRPSFSGQREQRSANSQYQSSMGDLLGEATKKLSEFRRQPDAGAPSERISFQELYKRNLANRVQNPSSNPGESAENSPGKPQYDFLRRSLGNLRADKTGESGTVTSTSLFSLKNSLRLSPDMKPASSNAIGGTGELPVSALSKELLGKKETVKDGDSSSGTEFRKSYSYDELGEKLRKLRPEVGKKEKVGWFSLGELNERLMKLIKIDERRSENSIHGYIDLRESLESLKNQNDAKHKAQQYPVSTLHFMTKVGGTPDYMSKTPKEHLVEKYFHPDNMSASEKMKIELAKVREEFQMSESDCGSARVQVAQLTTKIKYLSSTLHKKDKHSRKGLLAMVQRRKKLLKYLRRTDWESYCLVLDKLGLRDNPDLKF